MTEQLGVGRFFDSLRQDYTETIERCFPRYREMLWALLEYLPEEQTPSSILELGCGTGNLSVLLSEKYPEANIRFVDLGGESLQVCQTRLGKNDRFHFQEDDFRDLEFAAGSFDMVTSSIAIHHLLAPEKQLFFKQIFSWLQPEGVFTFADQFRGATPAIYQRHIDNWRSLSMSAGSSESEFEMWMSHQREHDHHDLLTDQLNWVNDAGFDRVDCTWRYLLWAVLQARKPSC